MFFVDVLEDVLLILQTVPLQEKERRVKQHISDGTKKATKLGNRFSKLKVETGISAENESTIEENQAVVVFTSMEPTWEMAQQILYEPEDRNLEFNFARYCLFSDLRCLRTYLNKIWEKYKSEDIDLITASVVTNTAFDLVKRAEHEFYQTFTPKNPPESLCLSFFADMCRLHGSHETRKEKAGDFFDYSLSDMAQWLYVPTYLVLENFCDSIDHTVPPTFRPTRVDEYGQIANRGEMSLREKLIQDKSIMMEILLEIVLLDTIDMPSFFEDEMTTDIRSMYRTGDVSVFLAFATQIFLDVYYTLQAQVGRALIELKTTGQSAKSTIEHILGSATRPAQKHWPKSNLEALADTWQLLDW